MLIAFSAGINPINVPNPVIISKAPSINLIGTVAFVNGTSSKFWVAKLIIYKINAPKIIPIIPAINVKNTDSKTICLRMSLGVAPSALRIPISLVLSFTEISKIFPIPITPARIVAIPIIAFGLYDYK